MSGSTHKPWRRATKWFLGSVAVLGLLLVITLTAFRWLASRREIRDPAQAAPRAGRFVRAHDLEVFVQEAGPPAGRPVLLIHGTGAWGEIWRETMSALAEKGFRVIALDVPPFGYSEKPRGPQAYLRENQAKRLIGVLETLNLKDAILVGHSVGARPTIEAALRAPERIRHLILVNPALGFASDPLGTAPHFEQNRPSWILRTFFAAGPLRDAVLATYGTNPLFIESLFKTFVSRTEAVTEARVKMLQQPLVVKNTTRGYGDWLEQLLILPDTSLTSDFANLKNLPMPVLLIWGSTDTVTPLWQGQQLKKLIPNSELTVMNGVGHIPYIENAAQFNEVLLKHLLAQR